MSVQKWDASTWNTTIAKLPDAHLLQSWEWGQFKAHYGWQPEYRLWGSAAQPRAAALILLRTISIGGFAARLRVMYLPKGPLLGDWADAGLRKQVLDDLGRLARQRGAIFVKLDPDVPLGWGIPGGVDERSDPRGPQVLSDLQGRGYRYSDEQIQFRKESLRQQHSGDRHAERMLGHAFTAFCRDALVQPSLPVELFEMPEFKLSRDDGRRVGGK